MSVRNINLSKSAQSSFILDPNPPKAGVNYFTSDAARDAYFSANPLELAKFDSNTQRLILMEVGGSIYYENRFNGAWVNAFGGTIGAIDLSQHSATELSDISNVGSGQIISSDERVKLGGITSIGSGQIITEAERNAIGGVANLPIATQQSSDFTAQWNTRQLVINTSNVVNITLPVASTENIGKTIEFLITSDPENYNIILLASSLNEAINTVSSSGSEVAKARISSFRKQFWSLRVTCYSENNYVIEEPDSVYNELLYKMFVNNTLYSRHNVFNMSSVIPDFLTSNNSWWFAIKFAGTPTNNSDGQVLFSTPNFAIAYRGNGTYMMTSGTSSFLMAISPNRIPQNGYWLVFSYDSVTTRYSCWINGTEVVKVIDHTTSGATPPSSIPTRMDFGRDVEVSAYLYGLMEFSTTCMMIGGGYLSDAQAAEFTYSLQNSDELTLSIPTNEWIPGVSDFVTKTGSVDLTKDPENSNDVEFSQL